MDRLPPTTTIVRAALSRDAWSELIIEAAEFVGFDKGHLIGVDLTRREVVESEAPGYEHVLRSFEEIAPECEIFNYCVRHPGWRLATDRHCISIEEMRISPFYRWAEPHGATFRIGLRLVDDFDFDGSIWFMRGKSYGHATTEEVARLESIAPALRLATEARRRLSYLSTEAATVVDALAHAGIAALIVDGEGRVVFANDTASATFAQADGIGAPKGRLTLASRPDDDLLRRLIANAARASEGGDIRGPGGTMFARRPSGWPAWRLLVAPLPREEPFLDRARGHALVLINDPDRRRALDASELAQSLGLTQAEAEIALSLAIGESTDAIALARGVAVETVRKQIKSVLAKAGLARRDMLVSLIERLVRF